MKTIFLILFLISSLTIFSQEIAPWNNIRNSAYTEENDIYLRCEAMEGYLFETTLFYSLGDNWLPLGMTLLENFTYEAVIPGDAEETLSCRFKTETDSVIFMMPALLDNDDFPPALADMALISIDPEGDHSEGPDNLDITEQYFAFSENKFFAALKNSSGEFPTDNGGWVPDEFYFYIAGLLNPEAVITDTVLYGLVYCNIPFSASPGLYKLSGGDFDPDTIEMIAEIEYEVTDNTLFLACDIEDLTNDEDFGDWPNLSNCLGLQFLTNSVDISMNVGMADSSPPSIQNIDQYIVPPFTNVLPEISDPDYIWDAGFGTVTCTYFDENGHFPICAELEVVREQGSREVFPLHPLSLDYSAPVTFLGEFTGGFIDLIFRFSDNGYEFVTETISVAAEDNELQQSCISLRNYPNPFQSETTISFQISNEQNELTIYNVKGQEIRKFKNHQLSKSSNQQILWDGKDEDGKPVDSGIYFLKLDNGRNSISEKMILMR